MPTLLQEASSLLASSAAKHRRPPSSSNGLGVSGLLFGALPIDVSQGVVLVADVAEVHRVRFPARVPRLSRSSVVRMGMGISQPPGSCCAGWHRPEFSVLEPLMQLGPEHKAVSGDRNQEPIPDWRHAHAGPCRRRGGSLRGWLDSGGARSPSTRLLPFGPPLPPLVALSSQRQGPLRSHTSTVRSSKAWPPADVSSGRRRSIVTRSPCVTSRSTGHSTR